MKKIAIIGGGPAGSTLAFNLDPHKYDVTIYQEKGKPRGFCAGGLGIAAIKDLDRKMPIWREALKASKPHSVNSVRLEFIFGHIKEILRHESDKLLGYIMDREAFDTKLLDLALERPYTELILERASPDKLTGYDIIVDARGYSAWAPNACKNMVYVEQRWVPVAKENDMVITFTSTLGEGYFWTFPYHDTTKYGFGERASLYPQNRDYIREFGRMIWGVDPWKMEGKTYAAILPLCGRKYVRLGQGNVFYVGTAAGLIDPLTGAGIRYAMLSGYHLAMALNKTSNVELARAIYRARLQRILTELKLLTKVRDDIVEKGQVAKYVTMLKKLQTKVETGRLDPDELTFWKLLKIGLSLL